MFAPHHERQWLTLRAAFGPNSAARALALQVQTATDASTQFRLISNLAPDHTWQCEGAFLRSDLAYRAYLTMVADARLTDYFQQPPKQMAPRWLIPSPEGIYLSAPIERAMPERRPNVQPSFWQKLLNASIRS